MTMRDTLGQSRLDAASSAFVLDQVPPSLSRAAELQTGTSLPDHGQLLTSGTVPRDWVTLCPARNLNLSH